MKTTENQRITSNKEATKREVTKSKSDMATNLRKLFEVSLQDIYWVEKVLTKAIPKMIKNATSSELIDALDHHLNETEEQVARLEKIFKIIDQKATTKKCEAIEGIIKEGDSIVNETESGIVRDAGIIAACQKIEHYEITSYGTLQEFAKTLGLSEVVALLEQTLKEEKQADKKLTEIAVEIINLEAAEK